MAHDCPDCGVACYCGGDIDDILLQDTPESDACTHCFEKEPDDLGPDDLYGPIHDGEIA
jgi:hypothetical protein